MSAEIRPLSDADRGWLRAWGPDHWVGDFVVSRGKIHHPADLPGFVALRGETPVGVLTYEIQGDECEIVSIHCAIQRQGVGSALMRAALMMAQTADLRRVWLITTNDNTPALRFYESREFRVVAIHKGAVDVSRTLKPVIPLVGLDGVEIHDEIELEIVLRY